MHKENANVNSFCVVVTFDGLKGTHRCNYNDTAIIWGKVIKEKRREILSKLQNSEKG